MPMEETYTYDALMVQFLYRELSAADVVEMAQRIEENPALRADYNEMLSAKSQLPKALFNPSSATLRNILQYSAKTAVETQF